MQLKHFIFSFIEILLSSLLYMGAANLSQEPGRQEAKQHSIVCLTVEPRHADVTKLPQLALPGVQRPGSERNVNQNNVWTALDKPPPKVDLKE